MAEYINGTVESVSIVRNNIEDFWNFVIRTSEGEILKLNSYKRRLPDPLWDEKGKSKALFVPAENYDIDTKSLDSVSHLFVTLSHSDYPSAISEYKQFKKKPVHFYKKDYSRK